MRILIISNLYPPNVVGGYERLCFEVTAGLAALGHDMTVLTSRFGGRPGEYPPQRIIRELDLLTGSDIYTPFAGDSGERERINQHNLAVLNRVLDEVQPDIVFAWNLFFLDSSILDRLEDSRFRTVVMLTDNWLLVMKNGAFVADFFRDFVHGNQIFSPPPKLEEKPQRPLSIFGSLKANIWGRKGSRRAPAAANSNLEAIFGAAFMRDLYAAGGSHFKRHCVIHNGVKQHAYEGAVVLDRASLLESRTLRLLFAGRLVDLKGAHTAVAAMALLDSVKIGVDRIELTILGDTQDASYIESLKAEISVSPRAADIILRPAVPENALLELFSEYDIYLFPSLYEPFSLTLIHALACGIPTIASDTGGNPEIITNEDNGLLFRKGDPADLARAIARLAMNSLLRVRFSHNGPISAKAFTFEKMVDDMVKFLERAT